MNVQALKSYVFRYLLFLILAFSIFVSIPTISIANQKDTFTTVTNQYLQNKNNHNYLSNLSHKIDLFIVKYNPKISKENKELFKKYIFEYSDEYGVNPVVVAAIIKVESTYNEKCLSSTGCKGPMQVAVTYHKEKLKKLGITQKEIFTIKYGLAVGCMILKEYLDKSKGDYYLALKRYNGSTKSSSYVMRVEKLVRQIISM